MIEKLIEKGLTIATAESCTGGLVAARITDEPGASSCFNMGVVTYSNDSKNMTIGVKTETLENFGAVSFQTALEMSLGIRMLAKADIGVSVTGIAGPGGGTDEKPVGLVYISISTVNTHTYKTLNLSGNRQSIRKQTVDAVYSMIEEKIEGIRSDGSLQFYYSEE